MFTLLSFYCSLVWKMKCFWWWKLNGFFFFFLQVRCGQGCELQEHQKAFTTTSRTWDFTHIISHWSDCKCLSSLTCLSNKTVTCLCIGLILHNELLKLILTKKVPYFPKTASLILRQQRGACKSLSHTDCFACWSCRMWHLKGEENFTRLHWAENICMSIQPAENCDTPGGNRVCLKNDAGNGKVNVTVVHQLRTETKVWQNERMVGKWGGRTCRQVSFFFLLGLKWTIINSASCFRRYSVPFLYNYHHQWKKSFFWTALPFCCWMDKHITSHAHTDSIF